MKDLAGFELARVDIAASTNGDTSKAVEHAVDRIMEVDATEHAPENEEGDGRDSLVTRVVSGKRATPASNAAIASSLPIMLEPPPDDASVSVEGRTAREHYSLPFMTPVLRRWRVITGWCLVVGSVGWVVGLTIAHLARETMPWCVAFTLAALVALRWLYKRSASTALYLLRLGELRPIVISEGLAISFIGFSLMICAFMVVDHFMPHKTMRITRQVVDIEFVSNKDAADRHDILPGTVKKADEQKKVQSNAKITQQGITLKENTPSEKSQQSKEMHADAKPIPDTSRTEKTDTTTPTHQTKTARTAITTSPKQQVLSAAPTKSPQIVAHAAPAAPQQNFFLHVPSNSHDPAVQPPQKPSPNATQPNETKVASAPLTAPAGSKWVTKTIAPSRPHVIVHTKGTEALEEVAPPEMVEVTDNEGDSRATELYQSGGRSAGGTGAKNSLSTYLKDLHRRIKHAWTPPAGEQHTAEILFRIQRTGKLSSIKLIRSSGKPEDDDAAMVAIANCSPFKVLPQDFPADYLDLQYTFNYTVDKLSEIPKPPTE